ncbi:FAS1 domain-containing protein SELMODRAFT_448915 [Citrus sinensis]|uniref:FAS1 domain-containing protein SELMODRAFT_448915 n=1 Tax=Citrus sinensis TaxID=2711 RepID=UPI002278BFF2|nr:FAS1 domain-containing protein SELMODRAFT_448915 [Citrus sinensis]
MKAIIMANKMTFLIIIVMALVSSAMPVAILRSQDLVVAVEEMQNANYFSFAMLVNMSPNTTTNLGNVTFLMPKDKILSTADMLQESTNDFLLRHSIPSALLFEDLERIPSGSLIPSSLPDYMLRISNGGRKRFFLNNVRVTSPNLCTAGSSIRCHGIDGVLNNNISSSASQPSCSSNSSSGPVVVALPPTASPAQSTVPSFADQAPLIAPQPSDSGTPKQKSAAGYSQRLSCGGIISNFFLVFAMVLIF